MCPLYAGAAVPGRVCDLTSGKIEQDIVPEEMIC
jgi:hypothetical protein